MGFSTTLEKGFLLFRQKEILTVSMRPVGRQVEKDESVCILVRIFLKKGDGPVVGVMRFPCHWEIHVFPAGMVVVPSYWE